MVWTDTIQIIGLVITFVVAVFGLLKSSAEKDKLEAETAVLYANLSADGAKREKQYKLDIQTLEEKIDEQSKKIDLQNNQIVKLKETIDQKDGRIIELESLTEKQEVQIANMRAELDKLKNKK